MLQTKKIKIDFLVRIRSHMKITATNAEFSGNVEKYVAGYLFISSVVSEKAFLSLISATLAFVN